MFCFPRVRRKDFWPTEFSIDRLNGRLITNIFRIVVTAILSLLTLQCPQFDYLARERTKTATSLALRISLAIKTDNYSRSRIQFAHLIAAIEQTVFTRVTATTILFISGLLIFIVAGWFHREYNNFPTIKILRPTFSVTLPEPRTSLNVFPQILLFVRLISRRAKKLLMKLKKYYRAHSSFWAFHLTIEYCSRADFIHIVRFTLGYLATAFFPIQIAKKSCAWNLSLVAVTFMNIVNRSPRSYGSCFMQFVSFTVRLLLVKMFRSRSKVCFN